MTALAAAHRWCPNGHAGLTRPSSSHQNMAGSSVEDGSTARPCCARSVNETASGHRSLAGLGRGPIGEYNLDDSASLLVVTPPYTTGLIKGGSRSRPPSLSVTLHSPACSTHFDRPLCPPASPACSVHFDCPLCLPALPACSAHFARMPRLLLVLLRPLFTACWLLTAASTPGVSEHQTLLWTIVEHALP